MTENLPAVVEDEPRDVARADTDSWIHVVGEVAKFAGYIGATDFVPRSLRDSPAAVTAAIMYGREVGLPPMTALTQTHVIEGKPSMSAEAMRALILAAGHDIEVTDSTGAVCTMRGKRRGSERWSAPVTWTIDAARQAGLVGKTNWKSYPRQMLQARCTAELARLVFPDVIHGFRAVEELDDDGAEETTPPPTPTTKVSRPRKTAASKSTPAPLEERERPALTGPPLPGEDGYEPTEPASAPSVESPAVHEPAEPPDGTDVTEEPPAGEGEGEAPEPAGDSEAPPKAPTPRLATRAQHRLMFRVLATFGIENKPEHRQDRLDVVSAITHRRVESFNDLTADNAKAVLDTLARLNTREELDELLATAAKAEADLWNKGDRS